MNIRAFLVVIIAILCLLPALSGSGTEDGNLPYAYLLPDASDAFVDSLRRQGIDVEQLREDVDLDVAVFGSSTQTRRVTAGTRVIRSNQKNGAVAASILESMPNTALRLPDKTPLLLGKLRELPENRGPKTELTLEMFDNGQMPNFAGDPTAVRWLDDEHFLQLKEGHLLKVHAVTGRAVPFLAPNIDEILHELRAAREDGTIWHGHDMIPASVHGPAAQDVAEPKKDMGKSARELSSTDPKGKFNAFVRNHNLYLEEVGTKTERALTSDGNDNIRNGKTDWVYFEEVYLRRTGYKHYWWSPDGGHIAFVRLDTTRVPKATVVDYAKPAQLVELTHYPRAGEPNALAKLAIAATKPGNEKEDVRFVDLSDYEKEDSFLITRVGWLPDGKSIYFCVQDRCQTWLDFHIASVEGGKSIKVLRDTTKAWVEVPLSPTFLKDGSIVVTSERTGWRHLFHYDREGKLLKQITDGDWDVRSVQKVDETDGFVYFTGTKDSLAAQNAYKIKLDGTGLERITKGKGDNEVNFSPTGRYFVNTASDPETPPQVTLHKSDGTLVRTLDTNPVYVQDKVKAGEYERVQIKTPDGFLLEASVQKPASFDANKKYPVWFMTYGGPRAPQLSGGIGKKTGGDQPLANAGYIVFRCDPRSASNKGASSAWACYKELGVSELKDIETAIKWLTANPWADAERVGMSGASYGGFLTAYCMCNSKLFAAGVATAPPTDWHNYDSIYTDRYMQTPAMNAKGYDVTSAVKTAKSLHGRLLLAHGLKDDNVHVQNTFQMVNALQKANKEFDIMLYPQARHGGFGPTFNQLQRDFMKKHLKPE